MCVCSRLIGRYYTYNKATKTMTTTTTYFDRKNHHVVLVFIFCLKNFSTYITQPLCLISGHKCQSIVIAQIYNKSFSVAKFHNIFNILHRMCVLLFYIFLLSKNQNARNIHVVRAFLLVFFLHLKTN